MRLDGSRVEAFTIGQINPFGLCFDPLGNLYTSDSHSKPIYQLLRGGRYEAFDRDTNDGLGLAPMTMTHLHNSTAIAGSQFYAADAVPEDRFIDGIDQSNSGLYQKSAPPCKTITRTGRALAQARASRRLRRRVARTADVRFTPVRSACWSS